MKIESIYDLIDKVGDAPAAETDPLAAEPDADTPPEFTADASYIPAGSIPPGVAKMAADGALEAFAVGLGVRGLTVEWNPLTRRIAADCLTGVEGGEWLRGLGAWVSQNKLTVRVLFLGAAIVADIRAATMAARAAEPAAEGGKQRFGKDRVQIEE